jgi:hypothetical protein
MKKSITILAGTTLLVSSLYASSHKMDTKMEENHMGDHMHKKVK